MSLSPTLPVSPLAPTEFPVLRPIAGVELGAVAAGLHYRDRLDLLLVHFPDGAAVAGLFTQNQIKAAPVLWSMECLDRFPHDIRGLVVNAGNANAFSGARGVSAAKRVARLASGHFDCDQNQIMLASTGVIGKALTATPFGKPLARLADGLSIGLWKDAAKAIMTTDTFPKGAGVITEIDGQDVAINGIAKGSGMIAPNMATMLAFIFTDANLSAECLQSILRDATAKSFNAVTVDADQSTNDTVLAFATGKAGDRMIEDPADPRLQDFKEALNNVMEDLAVQIVRDGEGASRLIRVKVEGAKKPEHAKAVARAICISPLVKTAIAGGDANWGRILMAAGNAGVSFNEKILELYLGEQLVASGGSVQRAFDEEEATRYLQGDEIDIRLDLGQGTAHAKVYTCDLTHRYIDINADYRS